MKTIEKKNYTWKLSVELVERLQVRAEAENRNLTNFIECIFMAATNTVPMIMKDISCDREVIEKVVVEVPVVKENIIKHIVKKLAKPEEPIDKKDISVIEKPTVFNFAKKGDKKYSFEGNECRWNDFRGDEHTFTITDELIELGMVKGITQRMFAKFATEEFSEATIFTIVKEWMAENSDVEEDLDKEVTGELGEDSTAKVIIEEEDTTGGSGYRFDGMRCHYKDSNGDKQELVVTDEMIGIAMMPGVTANTFIRFGGAAGLVITRMYINKYGGFL
jgi:hypothetical protein